MNEAETRAELIDPALKAAGWGVVEGSKILREYPITPGRIEGHDRACLFANFAPFRGDSTSVSTLIPPEPQP